MISVEETKSEVQRALAIESQAINNLMDDLDMEVVVRVIQAVAECKGRIVVSGCGTSATAAKKIAHSLCCIERPALFLSPADAVHGALGVLQPGDIFILISKGGNTSELVQMIPACKTKKATLIGVSENPDSIIAKEADIYLKIKVEKEPCRFNMLATASTLAVISTFDAICIALMQYTGYTREQFALIHPGGAVGDRLIHNKA
ncbi:SIS domain-containing protein [Blautia schinkii]|nr:SIS domain-containing protein [Blautia schinkii]